MSRPTFHAQVGPVDHDEHETYASEAIARHAVRRALELAAESSPPDAPEIESVIERLDASESDFMDYFTVEGVTWRARYWT